jgi:hypothetical protein
MLSNAIANVISLNGSVMPINMIGKFGKFAKDS